MKYEPIDIVAIIIVGTISFILITVILSSVITGVKLSDAGVKIVGDMNMALIALLALWMGSKLKS